MKTLKPELLEEIVRRLVAEFQPEEIYLFGSHAWGTPNEDSDVDLFVIVTRSRESDIKRMQRAHLCLCGMGIPKDILVKTRAEVEYYRDVHPSLTCQVLEKGIQLYARPQGRTRARLADAGKS